MDELRLAEQLDHVLRAGVPWRAERLTECGRDPEDPKALKIITIDDLKARLARFGQQRTAFTLCMTCLSCCQRYATWERTPEAVLEREIRRRHTDEVLRLRRELWALTALAAAHPEEFQTMVDDLAETPSLDARRRARARRR